MNEKRKKSYLSILNVFFVLLTFYCMSTYGFVPYGTETAKTEYQTNLPGMPVIKVPLFADRTFNIIDYGAVGDGHTKNTKAFADAIKACAEAGGGRVLVPAGVWLTGAIELKSNLDLHLEQGAVIQFSEDYDDYPLIQSTWEGRPRVQCMSPLYANGLENIAVTGQGIIDGAGQAWRPVKKFKMTERQWKELIASGGVLNEAGDMWWPTEEALNGPRILASLQRRGNVTLEDYAPVRSYLRPVMVALIQCKNVLLEGPTFQNSPGWNIHPLMCENMIVRNINVRNPWYSQNGDGLDLESCRNVIVTNCCFDVGDDAICLKSGRDEYGRRRGKPSENMLITDCTVYHGHGGFVIGSEMSGGVKNIFVRNCTFIGTDVGLRFKSTRGRGGVVENIFIENIRMSNIATEAIRFNMYYGGQAPIPEEGEQQDSSPKREVVPVNEGTPQFRKIYCKNITCSGAAGAVLLQGLPEMPIREIELENVLISADNGLVCADAEQIKLTNVRILPEKSPVFSFFDSRKVDMQNISSADTGGTFIRLQGEKTQGIHLAGSNISKLVDRIELGKGVQPDAITMTPLSPESSNPPAQ
ncbi:MAG: glycoside hydrolase family 28 protein [Sedimentisphaerales bacterium]|nr:glycoside hydrolase family 28 protein [Sedimentisphaerales bacterium]